MPRQGPDARDKAIGAELAELRRGEGLTQAELARRLDWTGAKLNRTEKGGRRIELEDVASILGVLGVGDPMRADLFERIKQPRTSGWWERRLPGLPSETAALATYQEDASELTNWAPAVIPGLLQTEVYANDFMTQMGFPAADVGIRWLVRLQRQQILQRENVQYTAILGEAALKTPFGGIAGHRAQLRRIREASEQHTVLVIPEYTPTPALLSAWLLLVFPEASKLRPVAHGELLLSAIFLQNEAAEPYLRERDLLLSIAPGVTKSRTLIDKALAEFQS